MSCLLPSILLNGGCPILLDFVATTSGYLYPLFGLNSGCPLSRPSAVWFKTWLSAFTVAVRFHGLV